MSSRHQNKIDKKTARKQVIKARVRHERACPDKVRIAARMVLGMDVARALQILRFAPTRTSNLVRRVLDNAVSYAEHNFSKDIDRLVVKNILVDSGRTYKRAHPVSHGMAKAILKRSCHVTVIVEERP
ncbi:MAG: 50S ribosomal protein L22 [Deltaproteobacteria bacterium]|jgi:large subunit ribosomal protein L22|nr:50S ribosomal protein L22 [Deltaproteobacteria bacterium]